LEKEKKKRLTDAQKAEIKTALDREVSVKDLAEKFGVTAPTIYAIKKAPRQADPLAAVVKAEIEQAEARVAELEKAVKEISWLHEKIKLKKDFLAALEKIEERK
jgi:transposase-like protein